MSLHIWQEWGPQVSSAYISLFRIGPQYLCFMGTAHL